MAHLSIISPVYRSAECLEALHRRVVAAVEPLTADFEIVLVDDGSPDDSWSVIERLAARDQRVHGLRLSRNFGQQHGITAGLDACDGDWAVVMDCDLQDRPEDIPALNQKALQGFDVVLARRSVRHDAPLHRLTSRCFYWLFSYLTDLRFDGAVGNFRIMSRDVVAGTRSLREQRRFLGGLVSWLGYPTATIEVENDPRFAGVTGYTFSKRLSLAIDLILAYSDKPLRLTVRFGLSVAAFALCFGAYVFVRALVWGIPVSGWASLMVSLYMFGGIIIGLIGMVGTYLSRVFEETKRRPLYVVRQNTHDRRARRSTRDGT